MDIRHADINSDQSNCALLREKLGEQNLLLESWRQHKEPLLFETIRALDHVFCEELFIPQQALTSEKRRAKSLMSWGVNNVLARMIPDAFLSGPFRLFESKSEYQRQADNFLLNAGIAKRADLLLGWLEEGLLDSRLRHLDFELPGGTRKILVLKTKHPSLFREIISVEHQRWMCELQMNLDTPTETMLGERFAEILPSLVKLVDVFRGWGITYSTTAEIDQYFMEWAQIYCRRMWSQDLLGLEEQIGGNQFNEYLGVLAALSARAQKHLCFASILKARYPRLDLRNLLTTFAPYEEFVETLTAYLDADIAHIRKLLASLTLDPSNRDVHTSSGFPAWAPLVRGSHDFCILPLFGLEINPFLFLLDDLEARYPDDWFRVANSRESRWIQELHALFPSPRWQTVERNVKLKSDGKIVTDVDFIAYDTTSNEIALFQLKWQKPVAMDNRARRSAGSNFVSEGNKWVDRVLHWLNQHGIDELAGRAGLNVMPSPRVVLFVIARYSASFSGFSLDTGKSTSASWNHLLKVRIEDPHLSPIKVAERLHSEAQVIASKYRGDSYVLPLSDLAVMLNPSSEPTE